MPSPPDPAPALPNRVRGRREQRGWTQAELARRAGISRAAASAIEHGRLSPSVASALRLAAALDCSVEELFGDRALGGADASWAWRPNRLPARAWEVEVRGRRVLVPAEPTAAGILAHDRIADAERTVAGESAAAAARTLLLAGCDPATSLLLEAVSRQRGIRAIALVRTSEEALELLRLGVIHAAGLHYAADGDPEANRRRAREVLGPGFALLRLFSWESGVAVGRPGRWSSRTLFRARLRWIGRRPGSGARLLQDEVLGPKPVPRCVAATHRQVAEALRSGLAEAGVCTRLVADEAGLHFVPLRRERYDLILRAEELDDPRILALLAAVRSQDYESAVSALPGYAFPAGSRTLEIPA
jgi:molybdate-binding protein/transcriptional regulator with XRE-family HTH domain